ncbi:MAG: class I SAM-dependent methyltransferase [Bacteroidales bacterium]|nr:class I SAM-dependent methyltransferase [Bacteroidales bacterium]
MTLELPSSQWADYELIDSGDGEKLERFGPYCLRRPEPKALWGKSLPDSQWQKLTHTWFRPGAGFGKAGKEDSGTWDHLQKMEDQWYIRYPGSTGHPARNDGPSFQLRLGLTSFKHVGVFPEQAPNWEYIYKNTRELVQQARKTSGGDGAAPVKVLNLFAYTGAASLAAKAAGADVTHLDSVRQVVTWARGNMEYSRMDGIRWVVEDALKFARREAKRGNVYQGIILDPPAYGHGPDGEKWKLDECLFEMLRQVAAILAPENSFMVLNLYSNGFSATLGETVVREAFCLPKPSAAATGKNAAFQLESGELALSDRNGKILPLSIFVRLRR